jgi:phosphoesterase RecJ-like protein
MLNKIIDTLKAGSSFLITTHMSPDGDAIGSSLALSYALKALGKNVIVYIYDGIPYDFIFLKDADKVSQTLPLRNFDAVITTDCANINRIGEEFLNFKSYDHLINIDHHKDNSGFGDLNLVDGKICSTGMLIYELIKALGVEIDYDIAAAIYTTILVDTGSFRYSNASAQAFKVAGELVEKGVSPWNIAEKVYENQPVNRINLLKHALGSFEIFDSKGFASITVTRKMLKEANANLEVTDGFINFPRSIKGVEVALFFKELYPNRYKLSLRSKGKADVAEIAANFGGGGHKNAAGCLLNGNLPDLKEKVFRAVDDYLKGL